MHFITIWKVKIGGNKSYGYWRVVRGWKKRRRTSPGCCSTASPSPEPRHRVPWLQTPSTLAHSAGDTLRPWDTQCCWLGHTSLPRKVPAKQRGCWLWRPREVTEPCARGVPAAFPGARFPGFTQLSVDWPRVCTVTHLGHNKITAIGGFEGIANCPGSPSTG